MKTPSTLARSTLQIAIFFIAVCTLSARAGATKPFKEPSAKVTKARTTSGKHAKQASRSKHKKDTAGPLYATRPEVLSAANAIAARMGLEPAWVRHAIGQSRYIAAIARASAPPPVGTAKNWALYRSRFIEPVRIRAGVKFWQDNREALERAEAQTGVPAAIIVGIVGVETIYGQQTGSYRVMDALTTLAFDFPRDHPRSTERAAFFLGELEAFLELTHRTGTDPLALRGSYAGAMGMPQFMPSSWSKYAVDFDGDGHTDLFHSKADVIGSVANYFKAFGWKPGMPTHYPVRLVAEGADRAALLAPDILPTFTPAAMAAKGGELDATALQHNGPLALVELQNGDAPPLYIAGTENYYAITRYNWSSYYALAVIELGQEVAAAMSK
ncbi:MAG: lytic murein transglycosylase B [Burkholderiales bacterium]|nr:lytic murein transglycosylase B [Burkholderiales bacterium]